MLHTSILESRNAFQAAMAQIAATAWSDGMIADRLKANYSRTVKGLCTGLGYQGDIPHELRSRLAESPVGDIPFEGTTFVMATTESNCATDSCGTVYSLTTECGCSDTSTGECSCFSIWGTSCWTCS